MPEHLCLDPHDPYAQRQVLVAFEISASGIRLISAVDGDGEDILADLEEVQRRDLAREVALAHGSCAGRRRRSAA